MVIELQKRLLHEEAKVLLKELQELGFEFAGDELVDLDFQDLREVVRQLRDTLRTIGGFRAKR